MDPRWLLLTDFASKYRISVSTLRRRIKNGSQPYRFEGGRYYLPDQLGSSSYDDSSETQKNQPIAVPNASPPPSSKQVPTSAAAVLAASMNAADEPLITTTSKLLNELKQAYTLILHEKEEQIVYLKEEIADLKTLVRVLESENARLMNDRERQRAEAPPERAKNPFGNA
ncbi:hypothetical protein BH10BDE1_BH10BDE1_21900 [soil metagenome]